jgi:hypothetical protein
LADWFKKQLSFQNILMVLTLVVVMLRSSTTWVLDVTESGGRLAVSVQRLVDQTDALAKRVDALERDRIGLESVMSNSFPRRSELEPRLTAIENMGKENNMMLRRFLETYPRSR